MNDLIDFLEVSRPDNAILDEIIIVGPYPSNDFIQEVINRYQPNHIVLVADYSAIQSVTDIESVIENQGIIDIRYVKANT